MEARDGFDNRAVAGGLDKFLGTLRGQANAHPALKALDAHGLLNAEYASFDVAQRQRWAETVGRSLGEAPPPPVRRAAPPSPERPKPKPAELVVITPASLITALPGISRTVASRLGKLGLNSVRDLLFHLPSRHIDYSARRTVAQLRVDEEQTVVATLWEAREIRLGRGGRLRATEAVVGDETGNLRVMWFGQPWVAKSLRTAAERSGGLLALSGKISSFNGRRQMDSPEWEPLDDPESRDLVHTGRLVPVYRTTEGVLPRTMRRYVHAALGAVSKDGLPDIDDPLEEATRQRMELMRLPEAVAQAHYPDNAERQEEARRRLAFDELLVLQLAIASQRPAAADAPPGIVLPAWAPPVEAFLKALPFELTEGQRGALGDAFADLTSGTKPMSRLLQGDVGSGKTVVAVALLLSAVAGGCQGALMAPTEVLAEQHYLNIRRMLEPLLDEEGTGRFAVKLEGRDEPVSFGLLTGSTRSATRKALAQQASVGMLDILIGTHAVIQSDVDMPNLGVAVVDEQHRFGVLQRVALRGKGQAPHLLLMSATPIPRTLAMTIYGDLEVSTIPELPSGRKRIVTRIVEPEQRPGAEGFLVTQAQEGHRSFVVCPLIDESESVLARAATTEFERLRDGPLSEVRVGLLHGRMPLAEKQEVMEAFRTGELDVLVSTPVIEVGIDVPEATVMLIEGADRFGLAQLHQLRGRVGRGAEQSYCFLLSDNVSEDAATRLNVLAGTNDGFDIAEADLGLRGPGDFFGTRQSGLPTLRIAKLTDRDLIDASREEARSLLDEDPSLKTRPHLAEAVLRYTTAVTDEVA